MSEPGIGIGAPAHDLSALVGDLDPLLIKVLKLIAGEDYELRRGAVIAVGKLGGGVVVDLLVERFQSDNIEDFLTLSLGSLPPEASTRLLLQALNDSYPETRMRAAAAMSRERHDGAVSVLVETLEEHLRPATQKKTDAVVLTEQALIAAVKVLGDLGTPMCQGILRKFLTQEANPKVRATAIAAITPHATEKMLPTFQMLLKDSEPRVRANAIEAIESLNIKSSVGILQPYLFDQHQRVRANAAKAMIRFGDFGVTDCIKEMLTSSDKKQLVSGIYAVGETRMEPFLKAVVNFAGHSDPDVRRNSVIAIRKFGKSDLGMQAVKMLDDAVPEVRLEAIEAVVAIYAERCGKALLARLAKETEPRVKIELVRRLVGLGDPKVVNDLSRLLDDPDEGVLAAAVDALAKLVPVGPSVAMTASLKACLEHASRLVRVRAMTALWGWGDVSVLWQLASMLDSGQPKEVQVALDGLGEILAAVAQTGGDLAELFRQRLTVARDKLFEHLRQQSTAARADEIKQQWDAALAALTAGDPAAATRGFEAILAIDAHHAGAHAQLGDLDLKAGRLPQALAHFQTVLERDPNHVKALYGLGMVNHRLQRWPVATEVLARAVRLYPKLANAYLLLADALEKQHRMPEAGKVLDKFLELNPGHALVLVRLGRLAFLQGRFAEAAQHLQQAEHAGPLDGRSQLMLAYAAYSAGDAAGAVARFHRALSLFGRDPELKAIIEAARRFQPDLR